MDLFRGYVLGDGALLIGRLEGCEVDVRYSGEPRLDIAKGSDSLNVVWCCKQSIR